MIKTAAEEVCAGLLTVRDFLRYAVSRFNGAKLEYGHGVTNAFDEAAFIVLETLKLPVDQLEPYLDARLLMSERASLADIIERRVVTRKPAPYLLNRAYIQGLSFYVDERVIIPRSFIGEIFSGDISFTGLAPERLRNILDLCTGSGCLAIMAAHLFKNAKIDAVDVSADALSVAAINVQGHSLEDRVSLYEGDLFIPIGKKKYDLIIANPPYVRNDVVAAFPPEHRYEPAMAHKGGKDGLELVRKIIKQTPHHLSKGGGLLCEIGTGRDILEAEFPQLPFLWLETEHSDGEVFWLPASD